MYRSVSCKLFDVFLTGKHYDTRIIIYCIIEQRLRGINISE